MQSYLYIAIGPPALTLPQNNTMEVNVSKEVILDCSASAWPDPVYTWFMPDSCSSCPKFWNESVMTFTVNSTSDSGDYICVAENDYGTDAKQIAIKVLCKSIYVHSYVSTVHSQYN